MRHGPFKNNAELPRTLRLRLPEPAQDLFREAFNATLHQHGDQEHSARMAWAAVRRWYEEKPDRQWAVRTPQEGEAEPSRSRRGYDPETRVNRT